MIRLRWSSVLAAAPDVVWRHASTMTGVNRELGPWLRMTHPPQFEDLAAQPVPVGQVLFQSWVLLGGLLPLDRHALGFEALHERGFDERSHSWLQRLWIHRRRVEAVAGGTRVTDELEFQPRLALMAPVLRLIVSLIFQHRHRQLQRHFGSA